MGYEAELLNGGVSATLWPLLAFCGSTPLDEGVRPAVTEGQNNPTRLTGVPCISCQNKLPEGPQRWTQLSM